MSVPGPWCNAHWCIYMYIYIFYIIYIYIYIHIYVCVYILWKPHQYLSDMSWACAILNALRPGGGRDRPRSRGRDNRRSLEARPTGVHGIGIHSDFFDGRRPVTCAHYLAETVDTYQDHVSLVLHRHLPGAAVGCDLQPDPGSEWPSRALGWVVGQFSGDSLKGDASGWEIMENVSETIFL